LEASLNNENYLFIYSLDLFGRYYFLKSILN